MAFGGQHMTDTTEPIPAGRLPVRVWEVIAPILALVLFMVAAVVAGAVAIAVLKIRMPSIDVDGFIKHAPTDLNVILGVSGAMYLLMLAVLWLICRKRGPATLGGYFGPFRRGQFLAGALVGIVLAGVVTFALGWLDSTHTIPMHTTKGEQTLMSAHGPLQLALLLSVIGVIGPIAEEVYFRGVLLAWLRRGLWLPLAAVVDGLMFSAVHYENANHPGIEGWVLTGVIATVGLLNAIFYLRTKSLWMPAAVHMFYNSTLVMLAYFGS